MTNLMEFHNSTTGRTSVVRPWNPTRKELVEEAREAFSNPPPEHLRDVTRVRNNTGMTVSISGISSRWQPPKNTLLKRILNIFRRVK